MANEASDDLPRQEAGSDLLEDRPENRPLRLADSKDKAGMLQASMASASAEQRDGFTTYPASV